MGVTSVRNQYLKKNPSATLGITRVVRQCCREIRIQMLSVAGKIYEGYNTLTEEFEVWLCISPSQDYNHTQLQQILRINNKED